MVGSTCGVTGLGVQRLQMVRDTFSLALRDHLVRYLSHTLVQMARTLVYSAKRFNVASTYCPAFFWQKYGMVFYSHDAGSGISYPTSLRSEIPYIADSMNHVRHKNL